jgi:hypothetical protein
VFVISCRHQREWPTASIVGSAAPDQRPHRAEQPHDPNHQAFEQSGMDAKPSNVTDTVIEAMPDIHPIDTA